MIIIYDIYVIILVPLLMFIYLCWTKENSQHSMLSFPLKNNIYSQVWLRMISDNYISIMVTYLPLIDYGLSVSNRIHSMLDLNSGNSYQYTRYYNKAFPKTMLASLVTHNSSFSVV